MLKEHELSHIHPWDCCVSSVIFVTMVTFLFSTTTQSYALNMATTASFCRLIVCCTQYAVAIGSSDHILWAVQCIKLPPGQGRREILPRISAAPLLCWL
jgi:hypothetical protein